MGIGRCVPPLFVQALGAALIEFGGVFEGELLRLAADGHGVTDRGEMRAKAVVWTRME